jgi:hypothetical protein
LKSRIVVWTIVGVLVLLGLIFILSAPKGAPGGQVTLERVKQEAAQTATQLDRLAARLAEVQKTAAPGADTSKGLGEAGRLLAQAREKLGQITQVQDGKQAESVLSDAKQFVRRARRIIELAGAPAVKAPGF